MDIKAPTFPESITEGTLAEWHKQAGDAVSLDDLLADVETDKVTIEVVAPQDGVLTEILKAAGETVESEEVIARFEPGGAGAADADSSAAATSEDDASQAASAEKAPVEDDTSDEAHGESGGASPAARKLAAESGVDINSVTGSGRDGRITKEDVARALARGDTTDIKQATAKAPNMVVATAQGLTSAELEEAVSKGEEGERIERRVPMTRLRATIAKRMVEAQHNAAMLTTFNEADMAPVMALRKQYQEDFQKAHNGTRLGFMSFFVRAVTEALKRFPSVNASIDGNDIVYHGYYDIGVAVSTDKGLVVPVVRDADALSLAQIEDQINAYGQKARDGKLALEDMMGGTFTISNGGIFGSMMSTPILNAPQTGVLGMHNIQERAVVVDGEIVIRPMMYLALSYDHRLIDGREAVQFLVAVKGMIEDPARILLEL